MYKIKEVALSVAVVSAFTLSFTGCGSGDSITPAQTQTDTGYLVDANVSGVSYISGSQSGITDSSGKFIYEVGENITFTIGGVKLGIFDTANIASDGIVYPAELAGVDRNNTTNPKVLQIAQFLQSLDSDNNPDNGITIDDTIKNNLSSATLDFTSDVAQNDLDDTVQNIAGKTLRVQTEVLEHYKQTLQTANITLENSAPTTSSQTINTNEDTTYTFTISNFTDGFSDIDSDTLTKIKITTLPTHGILKLNGIDISIDDEITSSNLTNITYTPNLNYNGTDSFIGSGYDGTSWSDETTMNISIASISDTPIATFEAFSTNEDISYNGTLTGSDIDEDILTYLKVSNPSHGTVVVNTNGTFTYTPSLNYNGTDSFSYKVNDGTVNSTTQTVTVTVAAKNDDPTVSSQTINTNEDTPYTFTVSNFTAGFNDIDGDSLTKIKITTLPSSGTLKLNGLNISVDDEIILSDFTNITYTPSSNYNGTDSFSGCGYDGTSWSITTTMNISIAAINDTPPPAPAPAPAPAQTQTDTGYLVDAKVSGVSYSSGSQSGVTDSTGKFTYEVGKNITFTIGGVKLGIFDTSNIASDGIIYPAELAGVDRGNSTDTKVLQIAQFLQSLDSDNNPDNGITIDDTIKNNLSGATLDFTSDVAQNDLDDTVENIASKTLRTQTQVLEHYRQTLQTANITLENSAPTFTSSNTASVAENQTTALTLTATDADGDTLAYSISGTDSANFDINDSTGVVTFNLAPDYETKSSYSFTATVSDSIATDTQSITIIILDVDEGDTTSPIFTSSDTVSIDENQTTVITLNATDENAITYSISGDDASAFNLDSSTGELSFKTYPEYDYKSSYTLTATANDGTNDTNQTISINVVDLSVYITSLSSFTLSGDANWTENNATFTSGDINDGQITCMEINSTLTRLLSFDWSVSSLRGFDFLRFYINDTEQTKISGTVSDTTVSYDISINDTLKWCYTTDILNPSGNDNGTVSNIKLGIKNSPKFVSSTTPILTENETFVIELNATDQNNDTLTYSLENNDSDSFELDSSTNQVSFKVAPTFDTKSIYYFTAVANDGVNITEQNITVYVKSLPFTHNSTSYQAIKSSYTGQVWLDRNLGATQVCTAYNDSSCYGDYYQWGRDTDGHEKSNSDTNSTIVDTITPNHDQFILDDDNADDDGANYDWVSEDDDGTQRVSKWSSIDGSSICPVGYRVPTIDELVAETTDEGVNNRDDAYTNFLKLPSAGRRYNYSGSLNDQGSWGYIWSSSPDGSYSKYLYFNSSYADWDNYVRAYGRSVRCLRD